MQSFIDWYKVPYISQIVKDSEDCLKMRDWLQKCDEIYKKIDPHDILTSIQKPFLLIKYIQKLDNMNSVKVFPLKIIHECKPENFDGIYNLKVYSITHSSDDEKIFTFHEIYSADNLSGTHRFPTILVSHVYIHLFIQFEYHGIPPKDREVYLNMDEIPFSYMKEMYNSLFKK